MKITIPILLCFSAISYAASNNDIAVSVGNINPNTQLLPSPLPVFVLGNSGVVNHPYPGSKRALLPTDNSYTDAPGCYIACYSHVKGIYPVSPSIYVMGQIRVKGQYQGRICQPEGYLNKDISAVNQFKQLCSQKIPGCKNIECWAGGDTGGWFGIQL
ncbi:hypothetical protein [Legionella clemsonensis]|uniref:Uncharacterized protein n=1 Tax=Legionella clemsonensis TaxID=1867846 RepID=A0A222P2R9_9GAMM|nr:hypothetical protein [Legionella clemsonensis]ASQ46148.1 hypothetical protein clem_07980 [Legionella clemsonensis]